MKNSYSWLYDFLESECIWPNTMILLHDSCGMWVGGVVSEVELKGFDEEYRENVCTI